MAEVIVVYESEYGNTKQIAQAICDGINSGLKSGSCRLDHVRDVDVTTLSFVNMVVVGCPTQKFTMMPDTKSFLAHLSANTLESVSVAAFDTRVTKEEFGPILAVLPAVFGYAAEPIAKQLKRAGGAEITFPMGFYVHGKEGPLLEGELDRAFSWGKTAVALLKPEAI